MLRSINSKLQIILNKNWKSILRLSLPFFVAVASGVTTFFIFRYFNKEQVSVESVLVRPKEIFITLERSFANKLGKKMYGSSYRLGNEDVDFSVLDKPKIIEAMKNLSDKIAGLEESINFNNEDKNKINGFDGDSLTTDILANLKLNDANLRYTSYSDELYPVSAISTSRKTVKQEILKKYNLRNENLSKEKGELEIMLIELIKITKRTLDENRNKFQIEVIAFNSGNQQTVIRYKGTMQISTTQLNLKKAETQRFDDYYSKLSKAVTGNIDPERHFTNYVIVEPKSFVTINLEIDNFNNKTRDIEVIKREYLSGQQQVDLTLYDIQNNPIRPYSFKLQNDVEYDPNEQVFKYIKNDLAVYSKPIFNL